MTTSGTPDGPRAADESTREKTHEWLRAETWPLPSWYTSKETTQLDSYEAYFTHQLRTRYTDLESDFRSVFGNVVGTGDIPTAGQIVHLLRSAREMLEGKSPPLLTISSNLDLVERYMTWLYPSWVLAARAAGLLIRVEAMQLQGREQLAKQIGELSENLNSLEAFARLRGLVDETMGNINRQITQERISAGLQLRRLKVLRLGGMLVLALLLLASPLTLNAETLSDWHARLATWAPLAVTACIVALSIAVVGGTGAFLSGLLQVRRTRVTLIQYQESMLKLQLRPIVGALAALILFIFLSWQILPGITIDNPGSYLLVAFLSGFSERYFLRLLQLQTDAQEQDIDATVSDLEHESSPGDNASSVSESDE